jgi:sarcosine oxidase
MSRADVADGRYDVAVVGVGGIGSAALYHLASAGLRVLGLERFEIAHDRGSSHGESRILRLAYFEDPRYVPLARRSLELWHALERESGERLFTQTAGIDGGPEDDPIFQGALGSCRHHGLAHEVLNAAELRERFPAFGMPRGFRFVLQPDAGSLDPEGGIEAHARMAEAMGAELRTGVRVAGWEPDGAGVRIHLHDAPDVLADRLVLTAGAWTSDLLMGPGPNLRVERQVVAWTNPDDPALFEPGRFPVFNISVGGGHHYGFPALAGRGPKIGRFGHLAEEVHPDTLRREATAADRALLQGFSDLYLRGAGLIADTAPCMFTVSDDTNFIVDRIPDSPVVIGCGFSGHGYKFAPAIGEAIAALVQERSPGSNVEHLRWGRPALLGPDGGLGSLSDPSGPG